MWRTYQIRLRTSGSATQDHLIPQARDTCRCRDSVGTECSSALLIFDAVMDDSLVLEYFPCVALHLGQDWPRVEFGSHLSCASFWLWLRSQLSNVTFRSRSRLYSPAIVRFSAFMMRLGRLPSFAKVSAQ